MSVTPLYRGGFLLILVRDIALPCTGNNALLRPSAAAPHRFKPTRSPGKQEGREAGSSVEKGTRLTRRGQPSQRKGQSQGKREMKRERIREGTADDAYTKLDPTLPN